MAESYILQDRGRMRHLISRGFKFHALLVRQQMQLVNITGVGQRKLTSRHGLNK